MNRAIRIALGSAVLVSGLAVAGASTASAQVRIRGSFPTPHGRISVDIGNARFPVGGYVPYGYDVYEDPNYGYGFAYEDQWVPCESRGSRWIIIGAPVFYGRRDYGYRDRSYRNDRYSSRDYRRYDDRRYRRDGRRGWDDRNNRRNDSRYRDQDRWRH